MKITQMLIIPLALLLQLRKDFSSSFLQIELAVLFNDGWGLHMLMNGA